MNGMILALAIVVPYLDYRHINLYYLDINLYYLPSKSLLFRLIAA